MGLANIIYTIIIIIALPFAIREMVDKEIAHIIIPILLGFLILIVFGLK